MADPTRLRQVILNLLGNAAKFTSKGGVAVELGAVAEGSSLWIEVADTGPGIPAELRDRLFQDFDRLDIEAGVKVEGAGLGLALSKRIVAVMGGRLGYHDNPGGGSVFWLELPVVAGETSLTPTPFAIDVLDEPPLHLAGPLHVLVVDDVLMNRDVAASFLRAGGHHVTCAEGGAQAVEAVATTDFDVVLMDVRMPEIDGLEATRRIRALVGERGRVPIVALTAQSFTDQIAECHKAGMNGHLAKPFDPESLLAALVSVVGTSASQAGNRHGAPILTPVAASADPEMGADLPLLDARAFDRVAVHLTPEILLRYLNEIDTTGEILAQGLRDPDGLISNAARLAGMAHKLAGSAGMFGFERVAGLGRGFERAVETGAADLTVLAAGLCRAIEVTQEEIQRLLPRLRDIADCPVDTESYP